jgi:hypothetical protein
VLKYSTEYWKVWKAGFIPTEHPTSTGFEDTQQLKKPQKTNQTKAKRNSKTKNADSAEKELQKARAKERRALKNDDSFLQEWFNTKTIQKRNGYDPYSEKRAYIPFHEKEKLCATTQLWGERGAVQAVIGTNRPNHPCDTYQTSSKLAVNTISSAEEGAKALHYYQHNSGGRKEFRQAGWWLDKYRGRI